jgi:Ca2+-binding RTX toxin-like protein
MLRRTKLNGMENLETRQLMAADLVGDILYIDGSDAGDQIEIRFDETGIDEVHVDINGDDEEFDLDDVNEIRVRGLGGNDTINIINDADDPIADAALLNYIDYLRVEGGADNDTIENNTGLPMSAFGDGGVDTIRGGSGNDVIQGGDQTDYLFGRGGNDVLYGFSNNLIASNANNVRDHIYGGIGRDTLRGGGGSDYLFGGDFANSADDRNYMYGDDGNDFMYGGDDRDYMYGGSGTDRLRGYDGNDRLYGESGLDYLYGGDDNDLLNGGLDGQNDVLRGQQGQDEFVQYVWFNYFTGGTYDTENDNFVDFESGDTVRNQLGMIATIGYLVI